MRREKWAEYKRNEWLAEARVLLRAAFDESYKEMRP